MKKFISVFSIVLFAILSSHAQQKQEFYFLNGTKASFVSDDGKLAGVEDSKGKVIIPKVYSKIGQFGNIIYCSGRQGAKHSYDATIYDFKGNEIIPESAGYANWSFIERNGHKYGRSKNTIINENGTILYKFKQLKDSKGFPYLVNEVVDSIVIGPGDYTDFLIQDYITTSVGSRKGICDYDGTEIIPADKYSQILYLDGGFNVYDGTTGRLDANGNVIIPTGKYDKIYARANGTFGIELNGKAGAIDSLGNTIFMSKYHGLELCRDKDNQWYYISYLGNGRGRMTSDGKIIEEPSPTEMVKEKNVKGYKFFEVRGKDGMCGIRDLSGKDIIPQQYYQIIYHDRDSTFCVMGWNNREGLLDRNGRVIIPCGKYDHIYSTSYPKYHVVELDGKKGLADLTGKELIPPIYDDIQIFKEKIIVSKGFMKGIVDEHNKIIIPIEYTDILPYNDRYTVTLYGKKGICDKVGNIIIPPSYTQVSDIKKEDGPYNGVINVKDGETSGLYTSDGKMIFPTGLFKHVYLSDGKLESRVNVDWYISAYNDLQDRHYCYDLDGILLCDYMPPTPTPSKTPVSVKSDSEKWFAEGVKEFKKGNYLNAIENYKKSLEQKKDANAYYNIGLAYYNLKKYKDAIPQLESCIKVSNVQSTIDDAKDLILDCRECIQRKKTQRAAMWVGIFCTALNVAATVVQHNQTVKNYNNNLKNRTFDRGGFVRDTSLDYLTDPRYSINQIQQENWREYISMTNGGQTMTFDQWYANVKAPAIQATNVTYGTSDSYSNSSTSSSSSYSSSISSSGSMCTHCAGSGDCNICEGKGFYYSQFDLSKKIPCTSCANQNGKCKFCNGTGKR